MKHSKSPNSTFLISRMPDVGGHTVRVTNYVGSRSERNIRYSAQLQPTHSNRPINISMIETFYQEARYWGDNKDAGAGYESWNIIFIMVGNIEHIVWKFYEEEEMQFHYDWVISVIGISAPAKSTGNTNE